MKKFGALSRIVRLVTAIVVVLVLGAPVQTLSAQSRSTRPSVSKLKTPTAKKRSYSSTKRSRAARLAQARAAARARAVREVQTPRFKIDDAGQEVPDVRAEAAIIYNPETNQVLWESNAQEERSIASITKVMTALVFFESGLPLSTPVSVQRSDVYHASTTYLRTGYNVTADDLLHLLLIGSDNAAARALARVSPWGASGFVDRMNQKAAELGLQKTHYADPSGLLESNVSSAYDMARLITFAAGNDRISTIMRQASHTVYAGNRTININSTNQLVKTGDIDVLGGKTGFINRAGYCLATLLRLPQSGQQVAVVVLGARSNQGRFWETRHLLNWLSAHTQKLFNGGGASQQQQNESSADDLVHQFE